MKYLFFLLIPLFCFSQEEELYYFIGKDSLVGVKNSKGEVIIPAEFDDAKYRGLEDGEKIEENLIFFMFHKENSGKPLKGVGFMYDRKGNFLFYPYLFDNGADYFSEGLMRIVGENNKVGFADKNGNIVIAPLYDEASPFHYGYADFCNGCYKERISEHDFKLHTTEGYSSGYINKKGEVVVPSDNPKFLDDIEIDGVFFPNPFVYNEKEQKIVDFFRKREKKIAYLHYEQATNASDIKNRKVYFEIVDTPREDFPFYEVYMYNNSRNREEDCTFIVSEDGEKVYHYGYFGDKTEFSQWEKQQKTYIKERRALNKKQENENKNIHRKERDF